MINLLDTTAPVTQRCVIRLRTTAWSDQKGLHFKKSLTFLRKQCVGFNMLEEDDYMIGAGETLAKIINLEQCADGVYEVVTTNVCRDWETGLVDDYDYELIKIS